MQKHMQPMIKDFDKLVKKEKYAILAGKKIDVSSIPSRVVLQLSSFKARMAAKELTEEESFAELLDMAARVCKVKHPEIDADWLLDNTDLDILTEFLGYVLAVTEKAVENEKKSEE